MGNVNNGNLAEENQVDEDLSPIERAKRSLEGLSVEEITQKYKEDFRFAETLVMTPLGDIIPAEIIEGVAECPDNRKKAQKLFENLLAFPFAYTGESTNAHAAFVLKQGDCLTLRGMFLLAAQHFGLNAVCKDLLTWHIVGSAPIKGRSTTCNTQENSYWIFNSHHWVEVEGQTYDLLFKTKRPPTAYETTASKTYKGVNYMVFSNGCCAILSYNADNLNAECTSQAFVLTNEESLKLFVDREIKVDVPTFDVSGDYVVSAKLSSTYWSSNKASTLGKTGVGAQLLAYETASSEFEKVIEDKDFVNLDDKFEKFQLEINQLRSVVVKAQGKCKKYIHDKTRKMLVQYEDTDIPNAIARMTEIYRPAKQFLELTLAQLLQKAIDSIKFVNDDAEETLEAIDRGKLLATKATELCKTASTSLDQNAVLLDAQQKISRLSFSLDMLIQTRKIEYEKNLKKYELMLPKRGSFVPNGSEVAKKLDKAEELRMQNEYNFARLDESKDVMEECIETIQQAVNGELTQEAVYEKVILADERFLRDIRRPSGAAQTDTDLSIKSLKEKLTELERDGTRKAELLPIIDASFKQAQEALERFTNKFTALSDAYEKIINSYDESIVNVDNDKFADVLEQFNIMGEFVEEQRKDLRELGAKLREAQTRLNDAHRN